ncbi:hypoxanthine phosphoribosyltransferase [Phosphitispora fastidiosa]|uniref:hypoxanthine phosphoribosyltransferase n=1 Tax=Phosphitispora fastidiosa TaxID=2837202 RepID=UPI001E625183|nr:hypoxanthine phosphoribosyltransferase [Phosphitispora fastidiosa]MBU7008539.1 hypoxanthine phosphoribosyltransferase [Phosphitispora fastidiosa]
MKEPEIGKILFSEETIKQRVAEMGRQISSDYRDRDTVIVSVLKGSLYFVADLTRQLTIPLSIDFLAIGLYPGVTSETGIVRITKDLDISITGRHVLMVEDVIGTGLTLGYICQYLESSKPASLKICTLLDNPAERLLNIPVDYQGFIQPDAFAVGYGLDYEEKYRNLPYIAELSPAEKG